ncbi:MAG: hypothetical protein D8M58_03245 [Calditrichaeota bacterium]|nr:MAG: hypothetical protein DWQ03_03835 [Calditrichota bacterium]MBL1204382.1 hypothetical protein [Calditrichota bacterium]NOG44211.1 hypothetical protein [Calditrichota bacterium]
MKFKSVFKYIFSILIIFSFACSQIERDNILDPKNNSSSRESVLLLEAFINTSDNVPQNYTFNYDALEAIDSLSDIYGDRLIWLEYHWNTSNSNYYDPFTLAMGEDQYTKYTTGFDLSRSKGVPDIFINGAENRVQGASNVSNVIKRTQVFASDLIVQPSQFTIETEFDALSDKIEGTYLIAGLGNKQTDEMLMRIVLTDNNGLKGKRTVRAMSIPDPVDKIDAGEFVEKDFTLEFDGFNPDNIIFILMDENGNEVLHAIEKEL